MAIHFFCLKYFFSLKIKQKSLDQKYHTKILLIKLVNLTPKSSHAMARVMVEKALDTGNLSMLTALPSFHEFALSRVLQNIKLLCHTKLATQRELFNLIQCVRYCFRSNDCTVTEAFLKTLGRLLIDHRSSEPDTKEYLNLPISLTFIEEISTQVRHKLNDPHHVTLFVRIITELIETQTANDTTVALLKLMAHHDVPDSPRIGARVNNNVESDSSIGEIVNFLGDTATLFLHLDPSYQVKRTDISNLTCPSSPLLIHESLYQSLAELLSMSCDFISNGNHIGRIPTDSVNDINRRKLRIDQYLQYLFFRARATIASIPHVLTVVAKKYQSDENGLNDIKSAIFDNAPFRHSFDNDKLFDAWFYLLTMRYEKPAAVVQYDNDASLFSANLFALGSGMAEAKSSRPNSEIMDQLVEMGFKAGTIKREYRKIKRIDPDNEPSVEILVSKLVDAHQGDTDSDLEDDDTDDIPSDSSDDTTEEVLKSRTDFEGLPFEYDSYVLENAQEGCAVRSLQSIDCQLSSRGNIVIPTGTTGKVATIDRTAGLLGKSIQVNWTYELSRTCWVKPNTIELIDLLPSEAPVTNDSVKIRKTVVQPEYKWGAVTHSSVGVVKMLDGRSTGSNFGCGEDDPDVIVDFPEQIGWRGKQSELIKVRRPSGNSPDSHRKFSGKRNRKSGATHNSKLLLITNPEKIIDESSSSSNPDLLDCLFDADRETFWKSSLVDQSENQIWIEFKIRDGLRIDQMRMRVDKDDFSFIPSHVSVLADSGSGMKVIREVNINLSVRYEKPITILTTQSCYYRTILLKMDRMIHGGQDCKIRGLQIHAITNPLQLVLPTTLPTPYYTESEHTQLFVSGLNDADQLVSNNQDQFELFTKLEFAHARIKQVQMSSKGTLVLSDAGDVFVSGDLSPRQDGDGSTRIVSGKCFDQISAHSTGKHWAAIDKWGDAWACGDNTDGQCAQPLHLRITNPVRVVGTKSPLINISAGHDYTLACDRDGNVCGWGCSVNGRLGLGELCNDDTHFVSPVYIEIDDFVTQVAAGSQKAVTLALTLSGVVYCWGDGTNEKLGNIRKPTDLIQRTPIRMISLTTPITKIVSGAGFCAALTHSGDIITWGKKEAGRLGHGFDRHSDPGLPTVIQVADESVKFFDVACGALHCIAIDTYGSVWTWGDNSYGQLGTDQKINKLPKSVEIGQSGHICAVIAGGNHSGLICHKFYYKQPMEMVTLSDIVSGLKSHVTKNDSLGRELAVSSRQFYSAPEENVIDLLPAGTEQHSAIELIIKTIKIRSARVLYREYLRLELANGNRTGLKSYTIHHYVIYLVSSLSRLL